VKNENSENPALEFLNEKFLEKIFQEEFCFFKKKLL